VIGLEGPWGHGKTSVIQMAIAHINESKKDNNDFSQNRILKYFKRIFKINNDFSNDKSPIIIIFNPWLFSNQNQLIKKFFDELIIAIDDKKIKNKIKTYVNKLLIPIVTMSGMVDPVRTGMFFKISEYVKGTKSEEESLNEIKKGLDALFEKLDRKVVVIIDDIDRLSPLEIRQIFQLVKLVADFPNTIYLLAFDKKVVISALNDDKGKLGEEYVKKIIQIPFEVPEVYKISIENFLFNQLNQFGINRTNSNLDKSSPAFNYQRDFVENITIDTH
jgi:predicted KAP-like P-loop ATPase